MKEETKLTGQRRFICVVPSCHPVGGIAKDLVVSHNGGVRRDDNHARTERGRCLLACETLDVHSGPFARHDGFIKISRLNQGNNSEPTKQLAAAR